MENSQLLYMLIVLFSIGSWVDINGIWLELPVLVNVLPEGWYLPSYITIIIQLANIGPVVYSLVRAKVQPATLKRLLDPLVSFLALLICACSCALLIAFWDVTAWVAGAERSVGFLSLLFVIGLTDCTSSVVFLSYLSRFLPRYVTAYYVGAGASGLIPSVLALVQGASQVSCGVIQNGTNGSAPSVETPTVSYLFSVEVFFAIVTGFVFLACCSFVLTHVKFGIKQDVAVEMQALTINSEQRQSAAATDIKEEQSKSKSKSKSKIKSQTSSSQSESKSKYVLLLLTVSCSFLLNGFMPSLQTFSVLPYGQEAYYITVCLYSLAQPLASFASFLFPIRRVRYCVAFNVVALLSAVFLVTFALMNPPPLYKTAGGSALICTMWVLMTACVSYTRPSQALLLREKMSHSAFFWCGVMTQCGACAGALLSFLLVNVLQVFTQTSPC